jgi:predicted nucleotidyltransferase
MTNDADATVAVQSLVDFERLKDGLADFGFSRTSQPHRVQHRDGGWVDLLPFSKTLAPEGQLDFGRDIVFNMVGYDHAVASAIPVPIADGLVIPVAPLPLYVLLKLAAFSDRKAPKDLGGVLHCLEHYQEDDVRRYGLDDGDEPVPYEYTCAYLVGLDGRVYHDEKLSKAVRPELDRFDSHDAAIVATVAREKGRYFLEDEHRIEIFELFRWFRRGADL